MQKYFPILNSVFSSSITESSINITLKNKLDELKASEVRGARVSPGSHAHPTLKSKNKPTCQYRVSGKSVLSRKFSSLINRGGPVAFLHSSASSF